MFWNTWICLSSIVWNSSIFSAYNKNKIPLSFPRSGILNYLNHFYILMDTGFWFKANWSSYYRVNIYKNRIIINRLSQTTFFKFFPVATWAWIISTDFLWWILIAQRGWLLNRCRSFDLVVRPWGSRRDALDRLSCGNLPIKRSSLGQPGELCSNWPKISIPALIINVDNKANFRYPDD